MFREEPIAVSCAKHTLNETEAWGLPDIHMPSVPAAFQDAMRSLIPGPDALVKFVQIGLNSYQELHVKTTEVVSSAADSVAEAGSSVLTTAGEAATAGMDAVCSVGEVAGDIASGCADVAGSLLD
jgi:hypothetical protein